MNEIEHIKKIISTFGYDVDNCGVALEQINLVEEKLQITIPNLLKQFYLQLGNHSLFQNRGVYEYDLVKLNELQVDESLMIFTEGKNQSIWISIPKEAFCETNPTVEYWIEDCEPYSGTLLDYLHIVIRANIGACYVQSLTIKNECLQLQSSIYNKLPELIPETWYGNSKVILDVYADCQKIYVQKVMEMISFIKEFDLQKVTKSVEFNLGSSIKKQDIAAIKSILSSATTTQYTVNDRYVSLEDLESEVE